MFAVIYSFEVKSNQEKKFENAWKDLTGLIYEHEGSLGSRLHKQSENQYIAYAQWPNREIWQKSGSRLPESANEIRQKMKESCEKIETLYQMDIIEDLLKDKGNK